METLTSVRTEVAYIHAHPLFSLGIGVVLAALAGWIWWRRDAIRAAPVRAVHHSLIVLISFGLILSSGFILGAFAQPQAIYSLVTSVWNDPEVFVAFGASPQLALLLTGGIGLFTTCGLYLLHRVLPLVEMIVQVVQRVLSGETLNWV